VTALRRTANKSGGRFEPRLKTVGLFAGVGGLELGMCQAGHQTIGLCEIDQAAVAVLRARFPNAEICRNIEDYDSLPEDVQLVTAGFPCQDLSQAGGTLGINDGASRSGLVGEVIRLLLSHDPEWVLLENVPFMLQLARGESLAVLIGALEDLEFRWAYRVVNTLSFGIPQRRERVYLLASRSRDPRDVLLADDVGEPGPRVWTKDLAAGFYWTEGRGGLGWAVDAIPTLKSGSTIGIPSPPAIALPTGELVTPGIRDAERLQGFPTDWTRPAAEEHSASARWRLVGNAVTVDVAEWIGTRLRSPGKYAGSFDTPLVVGGRWPQAAYNVGDGRFLAQCSAWPVNREQARLHEFIDHSEAKPLSLKAVSGFLSRYESGNLRKNARFLQMVRAHRQRMEDRVLVASGD